MLCIRRKVCGSTHCLSTGPSGTYTRSSTKPRRGAAGALSGCIVLWMQHQPASSLPALFAAELRTLGYIQFSPSASVFRERLSCVCLLFLLFQLLEMLDICRTYIIGMRLETSRLMLGESDAQRSPPILCCLEQLCIPMLLSCLPRS